MMGRRGNKITSTGSVMLMRRFDRMHDLVGLDIEESHHLTADHDHRAARRGFDHETGSLPRRVMVRSFVFEAAVENQVNLDEGIVACP